MVSEERLLAVVHRKRPSLERLAVQTGQRSSQDMNLLSRLGVKRGREKWLDRLVERVRQQPSHHRLYQRLRMDCLVGRRLNMVRSCSH